ncbi:MAG: hypothetical protein V4564_10945 [Pseudomonadota bacterium]|uniref:DUF6916 family protein n=1 Tax=Sphingomonas sp. ERG5 TaxID=1381597 RepID=UPI00054C052B|nr:hypothetical protein [Sphingomonas sp. ERG5]
MADDMLVLEDFERHIGTTFVLTDETGQTADLVLTEVTAVSASSAAAQRAQFSLLFTSHEAIVRPQTVYSLGHAEMGDLAIFLVPIARNETGVSYEACFG